MIKRQQKRFLEEKPQPAITNYRKKITEKEANLILSNQLNLLKKRIPRFSQLTLEKLKSYSLE